MRILVCRPTYFGVEYVINPWMEGQIGRADRDRAERQWNALFEQVARFAAIEEVAPQLASPDMCFTANAGLVAGGRAVAARFRMAERAAEEPPFARWGGLRAAGLSSFERPNGVLRRVERTRPYHFSAHDGSAGKEVGLEEKITGHRAKIAEVERKERSQVRADD